MRRAERTPTRHLALSALLSALSRLPAAAGMGAKAAILVTVASLAAAPASAQQSGCGAVFCATADQFGVMSIDTCSVAATPVLTTSGLSGGSFTMFAVSKEGDNHLYPPHSGGSELCLGSPSEPIGRYHLDVVDLAGADSTSLDLINNASGGGGGGVPYPPGGSIAAGTTWYFQSWTRAGGGESKFSTGLVVTFVP